MVFNSFHTQYTCIQNNVCLEILFHFFYFISFAIMKPKTKKKGKTLQTIYKRLAGSSQQLRSQLLRAQCGSSCLHLKDISLFLYRLVRTRVYFWVIIFQCLGNLNSISPTVCRLTAAFTF